MDCEVPATCVDEPVIARYAACAWLTTTDKPLGLAAAMLRLVAPV